MEADKAGEEYVSSRVRTLFFFELGAYILIFLIVLSFVSSFFGTLFVLFVPVYGMWMVYRIITEKRRNGVFWYSLEREEEYGMGLARRLGAAFPLTLLIMLLLMYLDDPDLFFMTAYGQNYVFLTVLLIILIPVFYFIPFLTKKLLGEEKEKRFLNAFKPHETLEKWFEHVFLDLGMGYRKERINISNSLVYVLDNGLRVVLQPQFMKRYGAYVSSIDDANRDLEREIERKILEYAGKDE